MGLSEGQISSMAHAPRVDFDCSRFGPDLLETEVSDPLMIKSGQVLCPISL